MTRDDIIRMAREAGIDAERDTLCRYEGWVEPLAHFATLVAAAEREACARVCDAKALKNEQACDGADADETISLRSAAWQISVCAAAIRARSKA